MKTYTLKLSVLLLASALVFVGCSSDSGESTPTDTTEVNNDTNTETEDSTTTDATDDNTTTDDTSDSTETESDSNTSTQTDDNNTLAVDTYYTQNPDIYGRWAYVSNTDIVIIDENTTLPFQEKVDENHITVLDENNDTVHLIRAGITDVKLKGEIATVSSAATLSISRGISAIGSLDLILINVAQEEERRVSVVSTTDDTIVGTIEPATETSNEILYVADPATTNDRVVIPENSELTMPTGDTQITVVEADNNATFNVNVVGEETDMGVLTVTDKEYNFKSYIENGNDWRYFGYNDGEEAISYEKTLKICNIGTADISGVSFEITLDSNASNINRTFSTNYDGSAVPFTSGECKSYASNFSFTRPSQDRDVKINIVINDNFNSLTWNDYTSLKVSQYPHHNLYFNSNTKTLNGILVAPGRNLINVEFSNSSDNNYIRVPLVPTDEYSVIISTPNITDEDVYMISSGKETNVTKMDGFTNVTVNEPDNNTSAATPIALFEGEMVAYLHKGDIDFYKIFDKPLVTQKDYTIYTDFNISILTNTDMNASTISTSTVILKDSSNVTVSGIVSYNNTSKKITFNPDENLSVGKYNLTLTTDIQSLSSFELQTDFNFEIDILNYPTTPQIIATNDTPGQARNITVTDEFAYVVDTAEGLQIIDISNPSAPSIKATVNTGDNVYGVSVSGNYAYIVDAYNGLHTIDISNPSSPLILNTTNLGGEAESITISENIAYIAQAGDGLHIVDISNPSSPNSLSTFDISGYATDVSISGDIAYLADSLYGLHIINIADLNSPTLESTYNNTNSIYGVDNSGDYVYAADQYMGLLIIDVSTPASPTLIGTCTTPGTSIDVKISGNYAYVADTSSGLQIIDISDPTNPFIANTIATQDAAFKVDVSGNFAYVADGDAGMQIINIQMYK